MTTSMCQRPVGVEASRPLGAGRVALPVLPEAQGNPLGAITGPRSLAAVKMLRISVTDVCNLRCVYCMPEEGVEWLPRSEILTFEEIGAIVRAAAGAGITHFKLTGGEPTARRDLPVLVEMLRKIEGVEDLSMTTNGILLGGDTPLLERLHAAGLRRITISLDTLRPEQFWKITRGGDFKRVWSALHKALEMGFERVKVNVVAMKGVNEDEIADLAGLTRGLPITVRFIEFMPLGRSGLTDDPASAMLTEAQIRGAIEAVHGELVPVRREAEAGVGPAKVWTLAGATGRLGFISAMSHPFCDTCNRLRLTAEGLLRSCLFDGGEVDLKPVLRDSSMGLNHQDTKAPRNRDLRGVGERLLEAFSSCVTMKPETHSGHGNKAMNRIGG